MQDDNLKYWWVRIYDFQYDVLKEQKEKELDKYNANPEAFGKLYGWEDLKYNDSMLRDEKGTLLDEYYLVGENLNRDDCKKQVTERSNVKRFAKPRKLKSDIYAIVMDSTKYYYDRFYKTIDTVCFECGKPIKGKERYFPQTHPMYYDRNYIDYEDNFYFCSDECKYKTNQKLRGSEGEYQDREGYESNGIFGYVYHIYNRVENKHYVGQTKYMPFFRWQEHAKSGQKGDITDLVFETICEVRIKSQEYLNSIEAWWIQKYICDYGKDRVMNLTAPIPTVEHLIERFKEMRAAACCKAAG